MKRLIFAIAVFMCSSFSPNDAQKKTYWCISFLMKSNKRNEQFWGSIVVEAKTRGKALAAFNKVIAEDTDMKNSHFMPSGGKAKETWDIFEITPSSIIQAK
jgi:hypothetical protein